VAYLSNLIEYSRQTTTDAWARLSDSTMPTKDSPNQITAMVGAAIMFEMISMIAENCAAST
jgi:hypothetical protein